MSGKRVLKPWRFNEINFLYENHKAMTYSEIAKKLNRSKPSIFNKCHTLGIKCLKENKDLSYYFLYHGEEIRAEGTIAQIAEKLNLSQKTIRFYSRPSARKYSKNVLVKVGTINEFEEENDESNKVI
ncbi:DNA-binding CsgD family transcriptional regulator [Lysinibacillus composti]|uniref:Uncharacterized protein n=1 Tax=Lysinibacillus composti TaxID=720633 RepID=A0A3N9UTY5_9BACI|nr:hypothetical protein [Lysinibacillus composti]MBM7607552.1 DNA-binding CsgD family transcriptional regulator [Lysinibacillus composti]RQW75942.1 hypothetical protein EBB45_04815 [Lysinibacillus composti]